MKLQITIDCDSAAFDDEPGLELARILRQLADDLSIGIGPNKFTLNLRDLNDNVVGHSNLTHYDPS